LRTQQAFATLGSQNGDQLAGVREDFILKTFFIRQLALSALVSEFVDPGLNLRIRLQRNQTLRGLGPRPLATEFDPKWRLESSAPVSLRVRIASKRFAPTDRISSEARLTLLPLQPQRLLELGAPAVLPFLL
jgi:hypothetical protein